MEKINTALEPTFALDAMLNLVNKIKDMKDLETEYFKMAFIRNGNVLMIEDFTDESLPGACSLNESKIESWIEEAGDLIDVDVVLIHNHPHTEGAFTFISDADIQTTHMLTEKFALKGVEVLDHIVVGTCTTTKEAVFYSIKNPQKFYASHVEKEHKDMYGESATDVKLAEGGEQ